MTQPPRMGLIFVDIVDASAHDSASGDGVLDEI